MVLQLADRFVKRPSGVIEDVLVQINKCYYPVYFLILDTQSVVHVDANIPVILGRSFLDTANALINCRNDNMTLEVNTRSVKL